MYYVIKTKIRGVQNRDSTFTDTNKEIQILGPMDTMQCKVKHLG